MVKLTDLRCNHEITPYGVIDDPVFSWKLVSDEPDTVQTAYRIIVSNIEEKEEVVADTGKNALKQSIEVSVPGFEIEARTRYKFHVHVWDNHGNEAEEESWFEAAPDDFVAEWIEPSNKGVRPEKTISMVASQIFQAKPKLSPDERLMPVTLLRKEFQVKEGLKKARVYATAQGIYEISFNGVKPDNRFLAPEYTAYGKYICYQTYDITKLLETGNNACGVRLADGWYSGRIGMTGECGQYGLSRAFFVQIELYYADGTCEVVVSDNGFRWSDCGITRYADIFIGEKQDNRFATTQKGFDTVGFNDSDWENVVVKKYSKDRLCAQIGSPVEIYEELPVKKIITTPKGEKVVDFGQVFAGIVRMTVKEKKNTVIKLEHTEVLDEKGNFINNIMGPNKEQTDFFITDGSGEETFEPRFTFHGFRYVKVTGLENWKDAMFVGLALTSTMDNAAEFKCSNELINRLYLNVRWSQYSNMISIPTDCPQRERAGWTGDLEVFTPTAVFNQDMHAFLNRWLENAMVDQLPDGQIPDMVPYSPSYKKLMLDVYKSECSAAWGDACIIVPWHMYKQYGDVKTLEKCYPMMEKWFTYIENEAETKVPESFQKKKNKTPREIENQKYLWNTGWHYGDWLVPSISKNMLQASKSGKITKDIIAPICYANDAYLMWHVAEILGKDEDAEKYKALCGRIKEAFTETCVRADGKINPDLQGMYVCALWYDMVPENLRGKMAEHLVELIKANGYCLDTGFVSTPILLDVLVAHGYTDVAFKLLYQEKCPSWLYEVKNGATTIWENWGAITPKGKVSMFSYNHYAFGAVFSWIYRNVAGINNSSVAYEDIVIRPMPDRTMTWAECSHQSVYGEIYTKWERKNGEFHLNVAIPCNTRAEIVLPDGSTKNVGSGKYSFSCKEKE